MSRRSETPAIAWQKEVIFTTRPASYVVAEAMRLDADAAGRRRVKSGCPWTREISNWENVAIGRFPASLLPRRTWLVATRENSIEIAGDNDGYVTLTFPLTQDSGDFPVEPGIEPEIDIYCDVMAGPDNINVLDQFHTLLCGRWPESVTWAAGSEYGWPRRGPRPVWDTLPDPRGGIGPQHVVRCLPYPFPYWERFARLPLRSLLAAADEEGTVRIKVWVGRDIAQELAHDLANRLRLNHVVLWNRIVRRYDPTDAQAQELYPYSTALAGQLLGRPFVLECFASDRNESFFDRRWSLGVDPMRQFSVQQRSDRGAFGLRFAGGSIPSHQLRLAYLLATDWKALRVAADKTTASVNAQDVFVVRTAPVPDPDGRSQRSRAAGLVSRQREGHPHLILRPAQSRTEIADCLRRFLPRPLLDALVDATAESFFFLTVARPVPPGTDVPAAWHNLAMPVTIAHLTVRDGVNHNELVPYVESLRRLVQEQCDASIHLDIHLGNEKESRICTSPWSMERSWSSSPAPVSNGKVGTAS